MSQPGALLAAAGIARDFGDIASEARACRLGSALFDFSFLSRAHVRGRGALGAIARLTTRPFDRLVRGRIGYALRTDGHGHVVADITVWCLGADDYEVYSGRALDVADLFAMSGRDADVADLSRETAVLAVQGPHSLRALAAVAPVDALARIPYFGHIELVLNGALVRIGRLGYTGERGFEIVAPRSMKEVLWAQLSAHARPAGFAAADVLRIEAGLILFTNELVLPVTALELGLGRFAGATDAPPRVKLISFQALAEHDPILLEPMRRFPPASGTITVTSACRSALARGVLGLGYVLAGEAARIKFADPTGRYRTIRQTSLPFYDPYKRAPRGGWGADDLLPR
jgi:glycine cleavage system aminomethyltransferase T